ncbi:MAG: prepilin-type N-terminal cleavage/methylation domain-containing protein [Bacilli bacterium]|nr:prepilin-type N-terminal cleavage/methylation domain-containing protein [Bacilli bacterium]
MKNKEGFTLVELLAVIVILAVILIIAIPQIMDTIKETKLKTMEDSAKLIATNAEKDYLAQQTINSNYNATSIPCSDVAKLSKDYASCTITYNDSGVATVKLKGADGGKFSGVTCTGTKDNINCKQALPGYTDAVELLTSKIGTGGLIKDDHNELRYQGATVDNYVTFNDESWRIVGLFNVDGEQRVKLVRKERIGTYSWDSSSSSINGGRGINEWSQADLMRELNGEYYNPPTNGSTWTNWYGAINDTKNMQYSYSKSLNSNARSLIGDAIWYLGGSEKGITVEQQYNNERGLITCQEENTIGCVYNSKNDGIERTTSWVGKVGLIYLSDFIYATSENSCKNDTNIGCGPGWLDDVGFTLTPSFSSATDVFYISVSSIGLTFASRVPNVRPSVYLIPGVQMKGSGTTSDPYVFAE